MNSEKIVGGLIGSLKKWEECSADEKLERLRHELNGWRRVTADLRSLVEMLSQHARGADGKVLVALVEAEQKFRMMSAQSSYNYL